MTIYRDGHILYQWFSSEALLLEIKTASLEEGMAYYCKENLEGLVIKNRIYFEFNDLEFLKNYPYVRKLKIDTMGLEDLTGVSHLSNLEGLIIENHDGGLDFRRVAKSLKELFILWLKDQYINFDSLVNLEELTIYKDTDDVKYPLNLCNLEMIESKRTNLNCFSGFTQLKRLELYSLKKLVDISGLDYLTNTLEYLTIEKCNKIESFDPILKLEKLKHLGINTKNKSLAQDLKNKFKSKSDLKVIVHS